MSDSEQKAVSNNSIRNNSTNNSTNNINPTRDQDSIMVGGNENDTLAGGTGNDIFVGRAGDDIINGGSGNDWIIGGKGADTLFGGEDADIFTFKRRDLKEKGNISTIMDAETIDSLYIDSVDISQMALIAVTKNSWVSRDQWLKLVVNNGDLIITNNMDPDNSGQIIIKDFQKGLFNLSLPEYGETENRAPIFQDFSIPEKNLEMGILFSISLPTNMAVDPDGDAVVYHITMSDGSALPSWLTYDKNTNTLSGIPESNDVGPLDLKIIATDPLGLSASMDLSFDVLPTPEVEYNIVTGTENSEELWGSSGNDQFLSGQGDDVLYGGYGDDLYVYRKNDGNDIINDTGGIQDIDQLYFSDLTSNDLTFSRTADHLYIVVKETGEKITVINQFYHALTESTYGFGLEEVRFADGEVWDWHQIQQKAWLMGVEGGSSDGDDFLHDGYKEQDDIIYGGKGDDYLVGGIGSDTYIYSQGDGNDIIDDYAGGRQDNDKLILTDLNPEDLTFINDGWHFIIQVKSTQETITIYNQFSLKEDYAQEHYPKGNYHNGIEEVHFANGDIWYREDIYVAAGSPDANNYEPIEGEVMIIEGTQEDDELIGTSGVDHFYGGKGIDLFVGNDGSDVYIYKKGDGTKTINDEGNAKDNDILRFDDLNAADLTFSRNLDDLYILVNSTGEIIHVQAQYSTEGIYGQGIETIEFANGEIWGRSHIQQNSWVRGPLGDNSESNELVSNLADDIFYGGKGDDFIQGGKGSDTYLYYKGDGNDMIDDRGFAKDHDILVFEDLNASDLTFSRDWDQFFIVVNSTGEKIQVANQFFHSGAYRWGIEAIQFANGEMWDWTQIQKNAWLRGPNGDSEGSHEISSFMDMEDTFYAGKGDDTLRGASNSDTYIYGKGDGSDLIIDHGSPKNNDKLVFIDHNAEDITLSQEGNHLYIHINSVEDTITIQDQLANDGRDGDGVEEIHFANGDIWGRKEILSALNNNILADEAMAGAQEETLVNQLISAMSAFGSASLTDDALSTDNVSFSVPLLTTTY